MKNFKRFIYIYSLAIFCNIVVFFTSQLELGHVYLHNNCYEESCIECSIFNLGDEAGKKSNIDTNTDIITIFLLFLLVSISVLFYVFLDKSLVFLHVRMDC